MLMCTSSVHVIAGNLSSELYLWIFNDNFKYHDMTAKEKIILI